MTKRERTYTSYPQAVSSAPNVRHRRELDASRERMSRPIGSVPRKLADWR